MFFLQHKVHVTLLPGVENVDLEFTMIYWYIRFGDSSEEFTGHAHWHHQFLFIHTTAYKRPADEDCGLHFQGRKCFVFRTTNKFWQWMKGY